MIVNGIETSLRFEITEDNKVKLYDQDSNCLIEMGLSETREVCKIIMEQVYLKVKKNKEGLE